MLILLSVIGYAPAGGVNRLIQTDADSAVDVPKPIELSIELSSSWKSVGARGALNDLSIVACRAAGTLEANLLLLFAARGCVTIGLLGGLLRPITRPTGKQVDVAVGVRVIVAVRVG